MSRGTGANNGGGEYQLLLPFDMAFLAKLFGPIVSVARSSVYSASGSDSGRRATFRKMARGNWTKPGVEWDGIVGDDRRKDDKPAISFVDDLKGGV